ncbi:hypothetical protein [Isoptericola sp. 178]|uniref:hypothetical protein n=1 Tax=Isoptericola sp. 178 TaxID=3064651 RepID=UPI002713F6A1|nr:hypothetical protein [Isoptericola sp. 178]MDO8145299.1 hypothetical protein [Isoptericola sp. 178]
MFASRRQQPPAVRQVVPLTRGERLLASAETSDGGWVVATTADLVVVAAADDGPAVSLRRPWCDVDRAAFDPERSILTVEWVDAAPDLRPMLSDAAGSNLPAVVRERVLWSVVLAETVDVPGGTVRVAVRRRLDGTLFSQAVAGDGVDLSRADVANVVDATESRVRGACGLPG